MEQIDESLLKQQFFHKKNGCLFVNDIKWVKEHNKYVMNNARYSAEVKHDGTMSFQHDNQHLSLKYLGHRFDDNSLTSANDVSARLKSYKDIEFVNVNDGIDIDLIIDNTTWSKQITVKHLDIPEGTECVDFVFELNTNMSFPAGEICSSTKFGEIEIKEPIICDKYNLFANISYIVENNKLIKRVPVEYLQSLPVSFDLTITLDGATTFDSGCMEVSSICQMDSTHFIIVVMNDATGAGEVVAGTISGTTITIALDGETAFESGWTDYSDMCSMDSSHFVIAFRDFSDSKKGKVIAGSLSGTTITITSDSATTFETGFIKYMSVCSMDSSHFVIAFQDLTDSNKGKVIAGSLSGTAITIVLDGATTFDTSSIDYVSVCSMDSSYFVITFRDVGDGNKGKVIAGSLSGTTITITSDSATTFDTVSSEFNNICSMDATHFIIAYARSNGGVVAGTISGTTITITPDSATVFDTDAASYLGICSMNSSQFVVSYRDSGDSDKGKVIDGTIAGTTVTLTPGGVTTFESGDGYDMDICSMDPTYFVIPFCDGADWKGKVIAGSLPAAATNAVSSTIQTPIQLLGGF